MLATAQPKTKKFVLGIIPARGGSKRLAKKNIKVLNGKELIAYTIEAAKNSKLLDDFLVSTDDDEIMKVSEKYGALVPFRRPAEISEDVDTVLPLMHAVNWYEGANDVQVTHVVLLQPTSPMRTSEDIDKCVEIALNAHAESVISFKKAKEHPFWCFTL